MNQRSQNNQSPSAEPLPLKHAVQEHYVAQRLDDAQLDNLEALLQQDVPEVAVASTPTSTPRYARVKYLSLGAMAASVLLVAVLLLFYLPHQQQGQQVMAIAAEVAGEHLKQNPLEVSSNDFAVVQNYFQKLDFLPSASGYLDNAEQVLGGRYCSIQAIPAAQIRYQSAKQTTLYQVAYDVQQFGKMPDVDKGEQPITQTVQGVAVTMWVERGIMMVSAENE